MPKLAIYVSKQDMRKLDPWRKKMNFSQIFIKALRREIQERSRVVKAPKGKLAAAARHYRELLADDSQAVVDVGYRIGADHVLNCRLPPETIQRLVTIDSAAAEGDADVSAIVSAIGDVAADVDASARKQGIDEETHPTWKQSAYAGYLKGVAAAWKKVCEQMRSK